MLYIKPDYFDEFVCTADRCEDTCCAGWQIVIDKEALKKYKAFKGPYRKELHKGINWHKKVFRQDENKRCAFLNDENLCKMYLAAGEGIFCRTCDQYPRHTEEFEDVREISLSISCPEVAKYLLARKEPVEFYQKDTDEPETCPDFAKMDFDVILYDILSEGRELMIRMLQDRSQPIATRLERVLHLAAEMQNMLEEGMIFSCESVFQIYEEGKESFVHRRLKAENAMEYSKKVLNGVFALERLREDWELTLTNTAAALYLDGKAYYEETSKAFEQWAKESELGMEIVLEQLAVYFIFTYFCGAVYHEDILVKAQASVLCIYIIWELLKARWKRNGEQLTFEELYEIVYCFSRELEHSDINLGRMERLAEKALKIK